MLDRIGLIGYGNIGKRHAEIIEQRAILDFVCDLKEVNIKEVPYFSDYKEAIKGKYCDIVAICTPNHTHFRIAYDCLKAGKDVIIEKPMTLSRSSAKILAEVAQALGRQIYVVKQNRYTAPVQWLKSITSELGELYVIDVNCYWNRNKSYYDQGAWRASRHESGGVVFTQFSHFIDIIYYLFGYAEVQKNISQNMAHDYTNFPDCGLVSFCVDRAIGSFSYSTCSTNKNLESSITIIAEKATIKIGGQYMNDVLVCEGIEKPSFDEIDGNQYGFYQGSASNHDQLYKGILGSRINGTKYIVDYTKAHEVVKMCEAFS